MDAYAKDILRRADQQLESANEVFANSFPNERDKRHALAIVGKVTGNLMHVFGEFLAYREGRENLSEIDAQRQARLEKSNAIRTAYAEAVDSGEWAEYDRLAGIGSREPNDEGRPASSDADAGGSDSAGAAGGG